MSSYKHIHGGMICEIIGKRKERHRLIFKCKITWSKHDDLRNFEINEESFKKEWKKI